MHALFSQQCQLSYDKKPEIYKYLFFSFKEIQPVSEYLMNCKLEHRSPSALRQQPVMQGMLRDVGAHPMECAAP